MAQPTFIVNLLMHTGCDFTQTFVFEDNQSNSPLNLTGYTACCKMRRYETSTETGTFTIDFGSDRRGGRLEIQMTRANTALLKAGKYFYDVVLKDPNNEKTRVVEGTIQVKRAVTRQILFVNNISTRI